jgi:hypothetical protein
VLDDGAQPILESLGEPGDDEPEVDVGDAGRTVAHVERRTRHEPVRFDAVARQEASGVVRGTRRQRPDEQIGRRGTGVGPTVRDRLVDDDLVAGDADAAPVAPFVTDLDLLLA